MTTWTLENPTSTSWEVNSSLRTITVGMPIGLLLVLTYAETFTIGESWTLQNPTSSAWGLQSPTSGGFSIITPTPTTWN